LIYLADFTCGIEMGCCCFEHLTEIIILIEKEEYWSKIIVLIPKGQKVVGYRCGLFDCCL